MLKNSRNSAFGADIIVNSIRALLVTLLRLRRHVETTHELGACHPQSKLLGFYKPSFKQAIKKEIIYSRNTKEEKIVENEVEFRKQGKNRKEISCVVKGLQEERRKDTKRRNQKREEK